MSLLWIWCGVLSALWLNVPADLVGADKLGLWLTRLWLIGPSLCLALSIGLAILQPALLWTVRLIAAMHLGAAIVASIAVVAVRGTTEETFAPVGMLLFGTVALLPVILVAPRTNMVDPVALRGRVALPFSILVSAAVIIAWSWVNIVIVESSARFKAAGRPYCLLVTDGADGYVTMTTHLQLNAFSMFARFRQGGSEDYQFTYHALLLAGGQMYNWSYLRQDFVPAVTHLPWKDDTCPMQPGFLDDVGPL